MEIWKNIEIADRYEANNLGQIRSMPRVFNVGIGLKSVINYKGKILKPVLNVVRKRYCVCIKVIDKGRVSIDVHKLVWIAFNGIPKKGMDIDHINGDSCDNRIENLQLLTRRQHITKTNRSLKFRSQYHGVIWNKQREKWQSRIWYNNKQLHVGFFINEFDAHLAYQSKLTTLCL
jgi:hypothetical protein